MATERKAWLAGMGVVAVAYGVWFVAVRIGDTYVAGVRVGEFQQIYYASILFLWLSPAAASFLVSYFSPRKKMLRGLSMAFVSAVFAVVFNGVFQFLGDAVDFSGIQGAVILFTITLAYSAVGSIAGSYCGYMLTRPTATER